MTTGMTLLFSNGRWQNYTRAENYTHHVDEGTFILWDSEGAELEVFCNSVVVGFCWMSREEFLTDPGDELIITDL